AIFQKALEPPIPSLAQAPEPVPAPVARATPPLPAARPDTAPRNHAQGQETTAQAQETAQAQDADPQAHKAARGEMPKAPSEAMTPVTLRAKLSETGADLTSGVVWRLYDAQPDANGKYKLLETWRTAGL